MSGIGNVRIIDQDILEATNLDRLRGAEIEDLSSPKPKSWREDYREIPMVQNRGARGDGHGKNANALLGGADLVLDGRG